METGKVVLEYLLPIILIWAMAEGIRLARTYAAKVADETLRAKLLDLVRAAEALIPERGSGSRKLQLVQDAMPKAGIHQIEAAVRTMEQLETTFLIPARPTVRTSKRDKAAIPAETNGGEEL